MLYIAGKNSPLYIVNQIGVARMLLATLEEPMMEEFDAEAVTFDFGGAIASGMDTIEFKVNHFDFKVLGHHFTTLVSTLRQAITLDPVVTFQAYPFSHAMSKELAQNMLTHLCDNWESYMAVEQKNLARWAEVLSALSDSPAASVPIQTNQVV